MPTKIRRKYLEKRSISPRTCLLSNNTPSLHAMSTNDGVQFKLKSRIHYHSILSNVSKVDVLRENDWFTGKYHQLLHTAQTRFVKMPCNCAELQWNFNNEFHGTTRRKLQWHRSLWIAEKLWPESMWHVANHHVQNLSDIAALANTKQARFVTLFYWIPSTFGFRTSYPYSWDERSKSY